MDCFIIKAVFFFIKNSFFCTSRKNPDGNNTNRGDTDSDDTDDFSLHQRFVLNFNREARLHIDCEYLLTFFCQKRLKIQQISHIFQNDNVTILVQY